MISVAVLMSTYNGENYIETQIESILSQIDVDIKLLVRDDGSTDCTCKILDRYQYEGKLKWYTGENLRSAKSFMNLIYTIQPVCDYYAFSDQDDYWLPDKLSVAVKALQSVPSDKPALYYGKTKLVDKNLNEIHQLPTSYVSKTMKQTVISSGCTGCTVCMNNTLLNYLRMNKPQFELMHDNWVHKVCVSLGGNVIYDDTPHILYRQHGNNVIGGNSTLYSRIKRHLNTMFNNRCYRSNSIQSLYQAYSEYMPEENKQVCLQIVNYHKGLNRFSIIFDREYQLGDKRLDTIFKTAVLLGVY